MHVLHTCTHTQMSVLTMTDLTLKFLNSISSSHKVRSISKVPLIVTFVLIKHFVFLTEAVPATGGTSQSDDTRVQLQLDPTKKFVV